MRYFGLIIAFLCITSCQYFDKKKVNANELLQQELKTVNWNEVDTYPSFSTCDSIVNSEQNKQCFESTLTTHIFKYLNTQQLIVSQSIDDTIYIKLKISDTGILETTKINTPLIIKEQIINIDSLLKESLHNLPRIYPATKRGQQVKTEFELPIHIKVN